MRLRIIMSNERMLEAGGVFGADKIDVETEEIPVDDAVSESEFANDSCFATSSELSALFLF